MFQPESHLIISSQTFPRRHRNFFILHFPSPTMLFVVISFKAASISFSPLSYAFASFLSSFTSFFLISSLFLFHALFLTILLLIVSISTFLHWTSSFSCFSRCFTCINPIFTRLRETQGKTTIYILLFTERINRSTSSNYWLIKKCYEYFHRQTPPLPRL